MKKNATLSTVIDADVKKAATAFCKKNGLKLQFLIEKALVEQLEDAIDVEAYHTRKNEPNIPFQEILTRLTKK